jgi:hypothetical protein
LSEVAGRLYSGAYMADRRKPVTKKPDEILDSVFAGHSEALLNGSKKAKQYLVSYLELFNSIPNAVKFYVYDLLVEDAYQCDDLVICREAVISAGEYLPAAQAGNSHRFEQYLSELRFIERGISIMVDAGEFQSAIVLCDLAIKIGLGKAYMAKKASIERMM